MRLARPAFIITGTFFRLKSKPSIPPAEPVDYFEQLLKQKNSTHQFDEWNFVSYYLVTEKVNLSSTRPICTVLPSFTVPLIISLLNSVSTVCVSRRRNGRAPK
jgi:hypothetical protein